MSETEEKVKSKKLSSFFKGKRKLVFLIILRIALLLAGIIIALCVLPKNNAETALPESTENSISGAWELVVNPELPEKAQGETAEEDRVYYVFDEPDKYCRGQYYTCYQGGVEYYDYELLMEDSVEKINLGTENLEIRLSGSKTEGTAKMVLILPAYTDEITSTEYEASEYVFEQAESPEYDKEAFDEFEVDEALLSEKWISNERTLPYYHYEIPYKQTVEIKDNGVMLIRYESEELFLDRYMYYSYTAKDSELTFALVTNKDIKYTVSYEFDENGNLRFTDDTTSASMFADAFFGEFTFYTEDNLPEAPVASADEVYYAE